MIRSMRSTGALTFRPVRGGLLRCNQKPGLGLLSPRGAEIERTRHFHKINPPTSSTQVKKLDNSGKTPVTLTVSANFVTGEDSKKCPFCGFEQRCSTTEVNRCINCKGHFALKRDEMESTEVIGSAAYCPYCYTYNVVHPQAMTRRCLSCNKTFGLSRPKRLLASVDTANFFICPMCRELQRADDNGDQECRYCHQPLTVEGVVKLGIRRH